MPVILRTPPPNTPLQHFRVLAEGFLMNIAQEEMVKKYPGTAVKPLPFPTIGWLYTLMRVIFLPCFRLVPWPIRSWMLKLFFVRKPQQWKYW